MTECIFLMNLPEGDVDSNESFSCLQARETQLDVIQIILINNKSPYISVFFKNVLNSGWFLSALPLALVDALVLRDIVQIPKR